MEMEKYIMIYETKKNANIRILSEEFVRNYRNKGKIIYKNKRRRGVVFVWGGGVIPYKDYLNFKKI